MSASKRRRDVLPLFPVVSFLVVSHHLDKSDPVSLHLDRPVVAGLHPVTKSWPSSFPRTLALCSRELELTLTVAVPLSRAMNLTVTVSTLSRTVCYCHCYKRHRHRHRHRHGRHRTKR